MTATEWSTLYGGKRKRSANDPDFKDFRRLPIDHCALSLQPWENPYCDEDGNIFYDCNINDKKTTSKLIYGCGIYTFKKI